MPARHRATRSLVIRRGSIVVVFVITLALVGWRLYPVFSDDGESLPLPAAVPTIVSDPSPATPEMTRTREFVSPTPTTPSRTCIAGNPARLVWNEPGIQIDAPFVGIGLDGDGNLGSPSKADKAKAGWFTEGPAPGVGRGNVLIDGHAYPDDSAIFKRDFAEKVAVGMVVSVIMDNGSTCSYRISEVWRDISKKGSEYPDLVASEGFYDFTGPEQLFGVTCSGSWNEVARSHDSVTAFLATPIN